MCASGDGGVACQLEYDKCCAHEKSKSFSAYAKSEIEFFTLDKALQTQGKGEGSGIGCVCVQREVQGRLGLTCHIRRGKFCKSDQQKKKKVNSQKAFEKVCFLRGGSSFPCLPHLSSCLPSSLATL